MTIDMDSKLQFIVFVFIVAFSIGVFAQVGSLCRPNERFLSCGGCQKTCRDPAPSCVAVCQEGCYCEHDQVRNDSGHCVKLEDCPPITSSDLHTTEPRSSNLQCPDNEEYKFCEPCTRTCENPDPMCPAQCARGCFCRDGLVRRKDGQCVTVEECDTEVHKWNSYGRHPTQTPPPIPYQQSCGPHQTFKSCQDCEKTCGFPVPVCRKPCLAGCFCDEGFLRSPYGQCVKSEGCPKVLLWSETISDNRV